MECAFCDKVNTDLRKFYENDLFVAIYNIRPFVDGHSLIMPKRHVDSLLKLNAEEKAGLTSFMDRTVFITLKYADAYQFDVILQEGKAAGQSVAHTHFHVLPRKFDDKIAVSKREWLRDFEIAEHDKKRNISLEETERIVKKLRFIAKEHAIQLGSL